MTEVNWIQTKTGKRMNPFNPKPEDICLEDIAWALSMKCRFGGHVSRFYSVAEHCVRVSDLLNTEGYTPNIQMYGLLHDAPEAYLPDTPRPLKRLPELRELLLAELNLEGLVIRAICPEIVSTNPYTVNSIDAIVKWADNVLLATEAKYLMGDTDGWRLPEKPMDGKIFPVTNFFAYKMFMNRFEALKGEISGYRSD